MSKTMSQVYAAKGQAANFRGGDTCTTIFETCTTSHEISALFRIKHPIKTWSVVADLLGLSERAAKYRMSATRHYTVEELRTILQSEDGLEFLEMLMAGAQPIWWQWLSKVIKLAAARRKQAEAQQEVLLIETSAPVEIGSRRRLKGIRDADKRLSTVAAEKETALGFLAPNHDRPSHSAVAKAQGKAQAGKVGGRR